MEIEITNAMPLLLCVSDALGRDLYPEPGNLRATADQAGADHSRTAGRTLTIYMWGQPDMVVSRCRGIGPPSGIPSLASWEYPSPFYCLIYTCMHA